MPIGTISPLVSGGIYYSQSAQQDMFTAYVSATQVTAAALALVGLQLWNPPTSGRNLVLVDTGGMIIATSASTTSLILSYGLGQTNAPTSSIAATTITSTLLGPATIVSGGVTLTLPQKTPIGGAFASGTFVNVPSPFFNLLHNTAAIGTTGEDSGYRIDLKGKFIVPPGSYAAVIANAATAAAAANLDMTWIEVPI